MTCTIPLIFIGLGFLADVGTARGTAERECSASSSGSCPDSTALLQSRVQVEQQLMEEASSAAVDQALSDDKGLSSSKFLIISCPSRKQVVWTLAPDMPGGPGTSFPVIPLIETGLKQPKGLAFDKKHGLLYVADSGAEKIFRYTLMIDKANGKQHLATTHARVTIVQKCGPVEWVTLDDDGSLFYSSPSTNSINKISAEVMAKLSTGEIQGASLTVISQKALQAEQVAVMAKNRNSKDTLPTDPPPTLAHISSLYEALLNPHVSRPAAICVDGRSLYWANQDGINAGAVVQGAVNPQIVESDIGPAPFAAKVLTKAFNGAVGIAKAQNVIFFTRNETDQGAAIPATSMVVTGFVPESGIMVDFLKGLGGARSLLWDEAQTMFVADDVNGAVLAFPTGRIMANAPRTLIASVDGAYGLALASSGDPWLQAN